MLQKDVAERLNLDESTIGNWEKDRTYPAVRYMPRLIQFLGCSPLAEEPTLGEWLWAMRQALGLSRKRLAARLGIDDGTIQRHEQGIWRPGPRNRTILKRFIAQLEAS